MKPFLFAYLLLLSNFLFSKSIDLNEALSQNLISIEVISEGGYSGKNLKISFLNQSKKNLEIKIPVGQIFNSEDSTQQDLIITKGKVLAIEKGQKRIGKFYGMCIQADNRSPNMGSTFNIGSVATGALLKVVEYIFFNRLYEDDSAQPAIWAVTNNHRVHNIYHPELREFVAKTLGREIPKYTILNSLNDNPGEAAYQYAPAKLEGDFQYRLDQDEKVSFGLFNENGEEVRSFFEDKDQKRGHWKFSFYFEISNLPKGKYSVRLTKNNVEIDRMEVEF